MDAFLENPAQPIPKAIVEDLNWEPDGVTLQVRFCEGCETYWFTGILAATLPIEQTSQNLLPFFNRLPAK